MLHETNDEARHADLRADVRQLGEVARQEVERSPLRQLARGVRERDRGRAPRQRGQHEVVQHRVLPVHELLRPFDDQVVHVLQRHAVGRQRAGIVAHLLLQTRHANLEEFIQVATGDADKP